MKFTYMLLLPLLFLEVLLVMGTRLYSDHVRSELVKVGEVCITGNASPKISELFLFNPGILEHHKATHYDYGKSGSGDYCPSENFLVIEGGYHRMLK